VRQGHQNVPVAVRAGQPAASLELGAGRTPPPRVPPAGAHGVPRQLQTVRTPILHELVPKCSLPLQGNEHERTVWNAWETARRTYPETHDTRHRHGVHNLAAWIHIRIHHPGHSRTAQSANRPGLAPLRLFPVRKSSVAVCIVDERADDITQTQQIQCAQFQAGRVPGVLRQPLQTAGFHESILSDSGNLGYPILCLDLLVGRIRKVRPSRWRRLVGEQEPPALPRFELDVAPNILFLPANESGHACSHHGELWVLIIQQPLGPLQENSPIRQQPRRGVHFQQGVESFTQSLQDVHQQRERLEHWN